jgi:glycolate oxidase FAD binding subunit
MLSDTRNGRRSIPEVDGVAASVMLTPADAQEVADFLADAAAQGKAVAPVGGGTALGLGNPPERLDVILSTERLGGVIDYEPTDLVLSVGAGARLGDVQAVLGEHGQRLPIDPPGGAEATIGGLIATGRWGPLRHSAGTMRDLLIGIAVAHPSGTVSRAGGMVVKNVSGYDMPRLYHGSLGTLGVIVSANFKLLPRPRAETTLLAMFPDAGPAFAAALRLRASGQPLAALEVFCAEGAWQIAVRVEGREQTVKAVSERVARALGGERRALSGSESADWWAAYVARQRYTVGERDALIRCAVRPRDIGTLVAGIQAALLDLGVGVAQLVVSPGIGVAVARLDFGAQPTAERLAEAQAILLALSESVTILAAPAEMKRGIDVWGDLPDGFEVMRALRAEFDPGRTINPGRFAGFL